MNKNYGKEGVTMPNNQSNQVGWNLDNSYAKLPGTFYSKLEPNSVQSPALIKLNSTLAESLGLREEALQSQEALEVFAGNQTPEQAEPLAQAYAGHQFGHFTMLGDGRAILLGEQLTPEGERFDIQLKGSGRTPYSRGGDGRAALGPMLREYIISEAMYALGIPTTRSLAVVTTGEPVYRETELPGAILTRVAASHIRVGTFQYAAKWGTHEELQTLADYTIQRHYPTIDIAAENRYVLFLREVIKRQAALIAKWQNVGFIHGVMNTDNMTICGETIDYGPCAFMDTYHPETVFSSIDRQGRYAYGNQPFIGGWNLARFAETLLPLFHENEEEAVKIAQEEISTYMDIHEEYWLEGMRKKLGIITKEKEDKDLIEQLLTMMQQHQADFTNTFRTLTLDKKEDLAFSESDSFLQWYKKWQDRLDSQGEAKEVVIQTMKQSNPAVIPRNYRVEEALEAAVEEDDYSVMERLLDVLLQPYEYEKVEDKFCTLPPNSSQPYRTYCGT